MINDERFSHLGTRLGFTSTQSSWPSITLCLRSAMFCTLVTSPMWRRSPVLVSSIVTVVILVTICFLLLYLCGVFSKILYSAVRLTVFLLLVSFSPFWKNYQQTMNTVAN